MTRVLLLTAILAAGMFAACGGGSNSNTNTNANLGAGQGNLAVDANNLPEGLSTQPIPPSANTTPGIPAPGEANNVPKGATPTPGIPSAEELKKPFKPGATPTPGIPDPATLRKQIPSMMKKKTPVPVNRPQ
jgi:hypothetical protein